MSTSTLTPRQSFRDVLAQVAEQARALLPEQVNGRLESAATLVLQGDVFFKDDGTVEVGSSDPTRYYRLVGPTCTCTDFVQGKAPGSWCKHRIAANLQRSVERVLARRGVPEEPAPVVLPGEMEGYPDNDIDPEPATPPVVPGPVQAPLPEAPASVNVRLTIGGREVQLTLRDHDEARLLVRLEEVLQPALDINSFTPVRMLADRVETAEVLEYQRGCSHVCRVCFASPPHTCWLNCDSLDTVGFTPHICKGNHVEGCSSATRCPSPRGSPARRCRTPWRGGGPSPAGARSTASR
jgi:hypothetical protein